MDLLSKGGTGERLANTIQTIAGVSAFSAALVSALSIWLQSKNYRKPLLQRYVVRILLMVPIYAFSSYVSLVSVKASHFTDPIREFYEAFTIYTFFQLLINYLGGERSLIIMTHGRAPIEHVWPIRLVLHRVDISDPYTFLAIKRGILQYAWLKPIMALAAVIMKACGVYREGYLSVRSGYFWLGLVYNVSVSVSLYALGLFWVCMHNDLQPFRPVPKFLSIKAIIFASYWQGFFLSILVWLGVISDSVEGYSPDNLAAAIQDALICMEMPIFAGLHWYAFSWKDFASRSPLTGRMPIAFALRDAFGVADLIEDSKNTFRGDQYGYRAFDSGDKIMAHEDSRSRLARIREGMRYEHGGRGKYWLHKRTPPPGSPAVVSDTTPLLGESSTGSEDQGGSGRGGGSGLGGGNDHGGGYGVPADDDPYALPFSVQAEEDEWYAQARELEFGDWNYPVISDVRRTLPSVGARPRPFPTGARRDGPSRASASRADHRLPTDLEAGPTCTAASRSNEHDVADIVINEDSDDSDDDRVDGDARPSGQTDQSGQTDRSGRGDGGYQGGYRDSVDDQSENVWR